MNIFFWILFGTITGWIAQTFVGKGLGCFTNIVIGIAGAIIGGLVFEYFGGTGITGFNLYSLLVSTIGAIILLAIINIAREK